MAPYSSTLALKIPWTEEPRRLQSRGSRRVGHDWATSLSLSSTCLPASLLTVPSCNSDLLKGAFFFSLKEYFLGSFFTTTTTTTKLLQSCPTQCDPIDRSPPGSPVPGILQARTLEWIAISFSRGVSLVNLKWWQIFILCLSEMDFNS